MIVPEPRETLRGQRNHMLQEHQVLVQARERDKEFGQSQMPSEPQSHIVSSRRILHEREVQQEHISQCSQHLEHKETKLRTQLQTKEVMMTSIKESSPETSESGRQDLFSAQELTTALRSEMLQETTACAARREWQGEIHYITHLFLHHQKKWIFRNHDPQKTTHGSIFYRLLLLHQTHDQLLMKVPQKGMKRRNLIRGKLFFDEK